MRPLVVLLFVTLLTAAQVGPAAAARFAPLLSLSRGTGEGQLGWRVDGGLIPTGYLLGPAAFLSPPEGGFVIADTLNRRLVAVDETGAVKRTIDLDRVRAKAKLAAPPLVADLALDANWRPHLVDAANNCVLALDAEGNFLRRIGHPGADAGGLLQATRVHVIRSGDVFIEDQARMRTLRFNPKGEPVGVCEGYTGLLFDPYGNFCLPLFKGDPLTREITRFDIRGEAPEPLIKLVEKRPIHHIAPLGPDGRGRLHFAYETDEGRTYLRYDPLAGKLEKRRVPAFDPGLDLTTPDWVTPAGDLCRVRFDPERCVIERWTAPFGADGDR